MQAMEDRELIVKTSAYIDRHRDEMLSLWEKIVSIESGTPDKEGVDRVGAVLKNELESAGVETHEDHGLYVKRHHPVESGSRRRNDG